MKTNDNQSDVYQDDFEPFTQSKLKSDSRIMSSTQQKSRMNDGLSSDLNDLELEQDSISISQLNSQKEKSFRKS